MTIGEFRFPSDIHHEEILVEWNIHRQLIRQNVDDHIDRLTSMLPGRKAPLQVSSHLVEPDARQANYAFLLFPGSSHQHDRFVKGQQTSGPLGESSVQADADGTRNKPRN